MIRLYRSAQSIIAKLPDLLRIRNSMDDSSKPEVETIELDQFLKLAEVCQSGGQAKHLIQSGAVLVNGVIEMRRGKKLRPGDSVSVGGEEFMVGSDTDDIDE